MKDFNIVLQQEHSTVVSEYDRKKHNRKDYQSERDLENSLIKQLIDQGYDRVSFKTEKELFENLREKIQKLNNYTFTESEWTQIKNDYLANPNQSITEKTYKIQEDHIYNLKRDDGTNKNIHIIDKTNIFNNSLQVMNQYEVEGQRKNIYDVTILVNGLPLVHIELKRRGVILKEAFNQINRYQRESFWADSGLFEYVQIFVISNGTLTKYYSNTVRDRVEKENIHSLNNKKKTSNSYEFTNAWADATNKTIDDLIDFASTFLMKQTLLNILTKYCVFTSDKALLVMRPYQIAATEKIMQKILTATNYKKQGTIDAGGYIWHTTGSGKTLTSFKTAQLVTKLEHVKKVLFVVDRKDLDYQTMKEYDKFKKGAANSNTSTKVLQEQLEDPSTSIIITTIQKLDNFIKKNKGHELYNEEVVLIFDECHRSQFGEMHKAITKAFKKYYIFGFTGTPIFAKNTTTHNKFPDLKTTEQVFGEKLHIYTIVDAIRDGNVLPFRIDTVNTIKAKDTSENKEVFDIEREEALLNDERISKIVEYILNNFDRKTKRNSKAYEFSKLTNIDKVAKASYKSRVAEDIEKKTNIRITGFNSILACASIEAAKKYYSELKKQQEQLPGQRRLKVAIIYSWSPNEEVSEFEMDGLGDENNENVSGLDQSSRDFLDSAIKDYNSYFNTNYDTSSDKFQSYYKDLSLRVKNKEVDILIVVNMFLTGFDATTLNTMWIDKKLRHHGLIQTFSRTNRILNSVKKFGNIVCFRNLEDNIDEAIAMFGDKDASGIVKLKSFDEYYNGYKDGDKEFEGYKKLIDILISEFPLNETIIGEKKEKQFIDLYNKILKTKNILAAFDDFEGKEIVSEFDFQNYQSRYLELYDKYRTVKKGDAESIIDDVEFEIELVKSQDITIDYILMLIEKYKSENSSDKEIEVKVSRVIDSSPTLRNKKDLILEFINKLNAEDSMIDDWKKFIETKKLEELEKIILDENLNKEETIKYIDQVLSSGEIKNLPVQVKKLMKSISFFKDKGEVRRENKKKIIGRLNEFFSRYFGI